MILRHDTSSSVYNESNNISILRQHYDLQILGKTAQYTQEDLSGVRQTLEWVRAVPIVCCDPNQPPTPRKQGSCAPTSSSSLRGGDFHEFDLYQKTQKLERENETLRRMLAAISGRQAGGGGTGTGSVGAVSDKTATKQQVDVLRKQRHRIRSLQARLRRLETKQGNTIPKRFTKVQPVREPKQAAREEGAGGSLAMSTDSLAAASHQVLRRGQPHSAGHGKHHYTKIAMDEVMLVMPGGFQKREAKKPGIVANPSRLAAKVMLWMKHGNISIRAVANAMADEMEFVADDMYVAAKRRNGSAVRLLPGDEGRPLDVAGRYDRTTVTDAIHSFQMAIDGEMASKLLKSDALHVCVDISTFGTHHMQAMVVFASYVLRVGRDAAGNMMLGIQSLMSRLPAIPVGNKIVREFADEEGVVMATSTARAAATSLILAGLPAFASHPCASWGVDGGGEAQGAESKDGTTHTSNKNGIGSYRNMLNVTREGFRQAMDQNGDFMGRVMDLHSVPEEDRVLLSGRPTPRTLSPVEKYFTVERELVIRRLEGGRPVVTKEILRSRPSMLQDPLKSMAMVKGGVAMVFDCTKHLAHTAAQHSYKPMLPFIRDLASVILALSNVWIHTRLICWSAKIFELDNCGSITELQRKIADGLLQLNAPLYHDIQNRLKKTKNVTKLAEPCTTRWGAVNEGAEGLAERLPAVAVVVPVALAEGTDESRMQSAVSVWSKDGFRHEGKLRLSEKNGKLCFRLTDPGFIFGTYMTAFFKKCCHGPILDATSHNKEMCAHSIGGVGSVYRRIFYFLNRLMWVVLPLSNAICNANWENVKTAWKCKDRTLLKRLIFRMMAPGAILKRKQGGSNKGGAWDMWYPLQYKDTVAGAPGTGLLMLNPGIGKSPVGGGQSALEHCYGPFYRENMANMVQELAEVIIKLSEMNFDEPRNFLPKGSIRIQCAGSQKYPFERRQVMVKAVFVMAMTTIQAVKNKMASVLNDPHLFLACSSMTEAIEVVDTSSKKSVYHVSTDEARANAALFLTQMREIQQGYAPKLNQDERLGEYMHGPLKEFCDNEKVVDQLKMFLKASNVCLSPGLTDMGFTHPRRAHFLPSKIKTYVNIRNVFRPKPLTAFSELAILACKAAAQPRTQNNIEGGFSLASGAFRAGKRSCGAELWSDTIRKKNVFNLGMEADVRKKAFLRKLSLYIAFRRSNRQGFRGVYSVDTGESERKLEAKMKEDLPQYAKAGGLFPNTNICDGAVSKDVLTAPNRNGGAAANRRHRGYTDADELSDTDELSEDGPECGHTTRQLSRKALSIPRRPAMDPLEQEPESVNRSGEAHIAAAAHDVAASHEQESNIIPSDAAPASENDISLNEASTVPEEDASSKADGMCPHKDRSGVQGGSQGETSHQLPEEDLRWIEECNACGLDLFEDFEDNSTAVQDSEKAQSKLEKHLDKGEDDCSDSEDEAAQPLIEDTFPDVQRRQVGKFKLEYVKALANTRSWRPCVVVEQKVGKQRTGSNCMPVFKVVLRRFDDISFSVTTSKRMFYILRTPAGPELILINRIFIKRDETDPTVEFSRVLPSNEACIASDRKGDLTQTLFTSQGKAVISRRVGSDNIQKQVEARSRAGNRVQLYHWGDKSWEAKAVNLAGAVYWFPVVEENNTTPSLLKQTLAAVQQDFSSNVKDLKELDCVITGEPFTEK